MPETISKSDGFQIIGAVFSDRENAAKAVQALREHGIADSNIQTTITLDKGEQKEASKAALVGRGFAESQALYYSKAVEEGKTLVAVHNVTDPAPVIDILDKHKAEYNPDGGRNVRTDVVGMTAGAALGAAAGAVVGTMVAGPAGTAVGAAAGAVAGGAGGAAAGKAGEHSK